MGVGKDIHGATEPVPELLAENADEFTVVDEEDVEEGVEADPDGKDEGPEGKAAEYE